VYISKGDNPANVFIVICVGISTINIKEQKSLCS
jgi:hypothetical protein